VLAEIVLSGDEGCPRSHALPEVGVQTDAVYVVVNELVLEPIVPTRQKRSMIILAPLAKPCPNGRGFDTGDERVLGMPRSARSPLPVVLENRTLSGCNR
jgi:hypothetical protein